jgi:hypothetical protein
MYQQVRVCLHSFVTPAGGCMMIRGTSRDRGLFFIAWGECDGQFYTYKLYPPEFHLVRQIRYDDSGESLLFADT